MPSWLEIGSAPRIVLCEAQSSTASSLRFRFFERIAK
jgi:hypothetical protein